MLGATALVGASLIPGGLGSRDAVAAATDGTSGGFPSAIGFLSGIVLSRDSSSLEVRKHEGAEPRRIRLSALTSVWKETEVSPDIIEPGDFLFVRVLESPGLAEGELEALRIWVNLAQYEGRIKSVEQRSMQLALHDNGQEFAERTIYFTEHTIVFERTNPGAKYQGQLQPGQQVATIGVAVEGGHLRATRIWVS